MAARDSMRNSSAPYLAPGEPIQAIFAAQTASALRMAMLGFFFNRYRIVAVTPQRIVVLDAGMFGATKAKGVVTELPRSTRLGPGSGLWHSIPAGSETLHVHRRFFKDVEVADSLLTPSY
jgi:hypothetical protein